MFLRTYCRVARDEHWCDCCCTYIQPGEEYKGIVEVIKKGGRSKVIVWKEHINPCCELPEPPDEDYSDRDMEDDVDFKKAA